MRGKKNKIQKIKEKYGDQDEEERQMKLELLGAKKVKGFDQKIKGPKIGKKPKEDQAEDEEGKVEEPEAVEEAEPAADNV